MWSFYRRRRNPLIMGSAKIIQHLSSSKLHPFAGKNTNCSAFSVFSPINVHHVPSKSNPSALFYQRFGFCHHVNPELHSSEEPNSGGPYHKQLFHKLKKTFDCFTNCAYQLFLNKNNTVPYTKRTRFILFPIKIHVAMGDYFFENLKKINSFLDLDIELHPIIVKAIAKAKGMCPILPETDPQSVRLRWILKDIIDALHKDLKKNGVNAKHLEGLNWEIFVITGPPIAACIPGGKILISSRFLRDFVTDAEVATVIGHEVAHMVAGHSAESTTFLLVWLIHVFPRLIFTYLVPIPSIAEKIWDLPFRPLRRCEAEADYIGMILMALAGYDPRVALFVIAKLGKLYCPEEGYVIRTHPSGKDRVLMLARVVEEALAKHEKVKDTHWVSPRPMGGLWLIPKAENESSSDISH